MILVGTGCKDAPPVPPSPRLFDDAEVAAFRADLEARLAASAKEACPAGAALVAIVEPGSAAHAPCIAQITKLASEPPPNLEPNALFEDRIPDVQAFDAVCGPTLEALVVAAAQHEPRCPVYPVGVRPLPGVLLPALATWKFLAYRARWLVEGGDAERGTTVILALLRTAEDFARGRSLLLSAMISIATSELVIAQVERIVDRLDPTQLVRLAGALDRTIAAGPVLAELMAAERDWAEATFAMPGIDPAWQLPGGWGSDRPSSDPPALASARDAAALLFAANVTSAREIARACPATATLAECHAGFQHLSKVTAPADPEAEWRKLARASTGDLPRVRAQVRLALVDGLQQTASLGDYVGKLAKHLAHLSVLRARVEVRRTGACEVPAAIRAPARLGEALPFVIANERVVLQPPPWIAGKTTAAAPLVFEFACRE